MTEMNMLIRLAHMGFTPTAILDIGAYKGNWTRDVRKIWAQPVLMIEADPIHEPDLSVVKAELPGVDYRICALSDQPGPRIFHRMSNPIKTGSSFYRENSSRPSTEISVTCQTLDTMLTDQAKSMINLVKIDTQGAEIDIINGGTTLWPNVAAIMMELSLLDYNQSAPSIAEMLQKMDALGFVLLDLAEESRLPPAQQLIQVNGLFVPRQSPLRPNGVLF